MGGEEAGGGGSASGHGKVPTTATCRAVVVGGEGEDD